MFHIVQTWPWEASLPPMSRRRGSPTGSVAGLARFRLGVPWMLFLLTEGGAVGGGEAVQGQPHRHVLSLHWAERGRQGSRLGREWPSPHPGRRVPREAGVPGHLMQRQGSQGPTVRQAVEPLPSPGLPRGRMGGCLGRVRWVRVPLARPPP